MNKQLISDSTSTVSTKTINALCHDSCPDNDNCVEVRPPTVNGGIMWSMKKTLMTVSKNSINR